MTCLQAKSEGVSPRTGIIGTRGAIGSQGTFSETHQLFKTEIMIYEMSF